MYVCFNREGLVECVMVWSEWLLVDRGGFGLGRAYLRLRRLGLISLHNISRIERMNVGR